MEDILYNWKKLSLTEEEDTKLSLSKSKNLCSKEFVLASKFLTKRALNVEAIGRTFKPLWRAKKDFKRFDGSTPARYLRFTNLKFWVQIHGLPMCMLNSETAIELGETLGQVTPCKNSSELVGGGDLLHVHVEIDVSKPLCRGRRIALDDNEEIWVSFKYEKLPNFCYWCGKTSFIVAPGMGDGLGGVSRPSQLSNTEKSSTTAARPTGESTARSEFGNPRTGKELEVLIWVKDPSVVFLAETLADEASLKEVQRNINFDNLFYVEKNPRGGGGLALYWKNSIDVHVDSFSKYHIDSIINKGGDEAWRFTGFYGEPATHKRVEAWNKLRLINTRHDLPWLCARDFNEITRSSEKLGGNNRSQAQMQLFRNVIDECRFLDLGYVGDQFTWRKHFVDGHSLWERLDSGLANHEWFMKFRGSKIHHLHSNSSDHSPMWITMDGLDIPSFAKPFRFKEMWLSDHECSNIVEAVWLSREEEEVHDHVIRKIDKCGKELRKWEWDCFGNVKIILSRKRKELKEAKKLAMRSGNNQQVHVL
ncbi:uncharacterized protein LOC142629162 [Castanea sativa]|uniref:uncharacterized protein LOC142629162 n=1 Tax=Castanea sativa TaxID=21020 RepID=UPI003F649E6A